MNSLRNLAIRYWAFLFIGLSSITCGPRGIDKISVKGSDTEVNLVLELAEAFMEKEAGVSISVTGGGSGMGIAALINGKTDIANSSRPVKAEENALMKERQIDPQSVIFAIDALALILHPENSIDSLSLDQIGAIYRGELSHWSELGGDDIEISLYGRQSNSGTFVYFRENILRAEYHPSLKQMNGTAQIIEAVKQDPGGIGYVGIGYVVDRNGKEKAGSKVLAIKNGNSRAIKPTNTQAILDGQYPITRPLFQYLSLIPEGKLKEFLRFELGEEGQKIILSNGYFPITEEYITVNSALGL